MNDQSATIMYRVANTLADVVAKTDATVARVEAEGSRLRRHNRPLYGLLAGIVAGVFWVGYEVHSLSALLESTIHRNASHSASPQFSSR